MRICLEIICLKTKHGFIASLHLQVNFEGLTGDVKFTETKFRRINILDANEITRSQRYKVKSRCISPSQARAQTSTRISLGGGGWGAVENVLRALAHSDEVLGSNQARF